MISQQEQTEQELLKRSLLNSDHTNLSNIGSLTHDQLEVALTALSSVGTLTKDPTGWIDPDAITVSYDSATDKITLTGTLSYFWRGQVKALVSPWTSDTHPIGTGVNYYLSSTDGISFTWSTTVWEFDSLMVAFVQHGAVDLFAVREIHSIMPYQCHALDHDRIGTYKKSGGALSGVVYASTTAANRRPDIGITVVKDEDLLTTLPALSSKLYTKLSLSGAGSASFTVETAEIVPLLVNRPYWNEYTGGAWQQSLMAANSYMTIWLIAVPVTADAVSQKFRFIWLQGQSNGTLASESALFPNNLTTDAIPALLTEFVFLAKVILKYGGVNWTVELVQNLSGSRIAQISAVAGAGIPEAPIDGSAYARQDGAWLDTALVDPAYPTRRFKQTIQIVNAGQPNEYINPLYEELP